MSLGKRPWAGGIDWETQSRSRWGCWTSQGGQGLRNQRGWPRARAAGWDTCGFQLSCLLCFRVTTVLPFSHIKNESNLKGNTPPSPPENNSLFTWNGKFLDTGFASSQGFQSCEVSLHFHWDKIRINWTETWALAWSYTSYSQSILSSVALDHL